MQLVLLHHLRTWWDFGLICVEGLLGNLESLLLSNLELHVVRASSPLGVAFDTGFHNCSNVISCG